MAVLTDIADAVATEINGSGLLADGVLAARSFLPRFTLEEMATLHVTVAPKAVAQERADRTSYQGDYSVDVAVQKRIEDPAGASPYDPAAVDALLTLVERIGDLFKAVQILDGQAVLVGIENSPVYSQEHLEQMHQFTSVLTLTFRVIP